jgi:catechol 2,3-dioxygenase-like lactoylglutathione lyase family enzyme
MTGQHPLRLQGIDHVVLKVTDIERALGFYVGVLGLNLERVIEETLEADNPDAILTLDYDSVFTRRDAAMLMQLMCCYPDADAIAAVQAGRGSLAGRLFTMRGEDGQNVRQVPADLFEQDLTQVSTAHFGLTLLSADKLRAMPKPWFRDVPDPEGSWNTGRVDADIAFWNAWNTEGNSLHLANRVPIGHLELTVLWPAPLGENTAPLTQPVGEWRASGKPAAAWQ